jgi:hydroxylamine reductase (hybrid-cluster protein)
MALHTGSCVDNARAASIAMAIANKLGVDVSQLPVVATALQEHCPWQHVVVLSPHVGLDVF